MTVIIAGTHKAIIVFPIRIICSTTHIGGRHSCRMLLLVILIVDADADADADLADLPDAGRCRWDARDKKATGTEDNQTIPDTCNNSTRT
jgi:hypothetical protein